MAEQNYSNHTKLVPPFHFFLLPLLFLIFIGSIVNLVKSMGDHERLYSAALVAALSFCSLGIALAARVFALGAQDRAIRAEESLRHYVLTGKLLDPRLKLKQIVALRFAADAEFTALAKQAAEQGTAPGDIKKSIKNWKADLERV